MTPRNAQDRIRELIYPLYKRLPPRLKKFARILFGYVSGPLFSRRARWIKKHYTVFGLEQRRRIFMEIAHFATINRPIDGYYFEFGCHEANTIRLAFDSFRHLFDWHYVAFDSFEGLPEITAIDKQEIWQKGKLKTTEDAFIKTCIRHGIPRNRLTTVKGFYEHSLVESTAARFLPHKAAVIYVDCDLYASTVPVLNFVTKFLQPGTVIVFDDWNCFCADPDRGERRAWREFTEQLSHFHFEPFASTGMQMAFVYTGLREKYPSAPETAYRPPL